MFQSYIIREGWESPLRLELDLEFCPHEECCEILKLLRYGCTSECDVDILYLIDNLITRLHEINYGVKFRKPNDSFINLIQYSFRYLNTRQAERDFNKRRMDIYKIYNHYLKNEPSENSPHPISPVSPPSIQKVSKKEETKGVKFPKIMKKARRR